MAEKDLQAVKTETAGFSGKTVIPDDPHALTRIDRASIAADSHKGLVRRNNEDSFFYALNPDGSRLIAAVADGIGGNENGEIASSLVCKMLLMRWRALTASGGPAGSGDAANFLKHAILKINSALFRINESDNSKPMGTTLAVMMAGENWMVSAHCGDSRLYRLRAGELTLLTNDHSLVNEMVQNGELTPEEAKTHPYAHVITRSVGPMKNPDPEIRICERLPGDRYLLCSDGLTLHIGEEQLRSVLLDAFEPSQAVKKLMRLVLQSGARDNTTIVSVFA